ncbi:MAG: carboxypeptidase-like regulatory domain-containing protein, partial [Ignavibacteriaceae bacterium]
MIKKHLKFIFVAILFFLIIFSIKSLAGTTGKISGKIIDTSNGEPLIGANVIILGTNLGAATDFDGNFFIINIPPGKYEVKASIIGYNSVLIQNVTVSVDQTTKLNFELQEEAIEVGEVIVVATRPIVQKDLTSTQA